jgi:hypothetical protein
MYRASLQLDAGRSSVCVDETTIIFGASLSAHTRVHIRLCVIWDVTQFITRYGWTKMSVIALQGRTKGLTQHSDAWLVACPPTSTQSICNLLERWNGVSRFVHRDSTHRRRSLLMHRHGRLLEAKWTRRATRMLSFCVERFSLENSSWCQIDDARTMFERDSNVNHSSTMTTRPKRWTRTKQKTLDNRIGKSRSFGSHQCATWNLEVKHIIRSFILYINCWSTSCRTNQRAAVQINQSAHGETIPTVIVRRMTMQRVCHECTNRQEERERGKENDNSIELNSPSD